MMESGYYLKVSPTGERDLYEVLDVGRGSRWTGAELPTPKPGDIVRVLSGYVIEVKLRGQVSHMCVERDFTEILDTAAPETEALRIAATGYREKQVAQEGERRRESERVEERRTRERAEVEALKREIKRKEEEGRRQEAAQEEEQIVKLLEETIQQLPEAAREGWRMLLGQLRSALRKRTS